MKGSKLKLALLAIPIYAIVGCAYPNEDKSFTGADEPKKSADQSENKGASGTSPTLGSHTYEGRP